MIIINDRHDTTQTYGNWSADDDILTINFPDADYAPLTELNLPRTCSMRIEKQTSKEMILNYQASTEQNFIYTFRKW
jgi:broad specificity polyphosphatase/5'/3'-nucleotidase SurE